jgi:hypothetical protein
MHCPPQMVVYLAVCNYLTEAEVAALKNDLSQCNARSNQRFLQILSKHFDIEVFLKKPFVWQDIWLYNHIMYDKGKSWSRKNGLVAKYEREIILPQKHIVEEAKQLLKNFDL